MVYYMRTGKHQFNYQAYAIKWAINIMANEKGYSVNRAYQIDRVFGNLVERWLDYYQTQLAYIKRFSEIKGAYNGAIRDFDNFSNELREVIIRYHANPPDYNKYAVTYNKYLGSFGAALSAYRNSEALAPVYEMTAITDTMKELINKIENISVANLVILPKELQKDMQEVHKMGIKIANDILFNHLGIIGIVNNNLSIDNDELMKLTKEYTDSFAYYIGYSFNEYVDAYNALQDKYRGYLMND